MQSCSILSSNMSVTHTIEVNSCDTLPKYLSCRVSPLCLLRIYPTRVTASGKTINYLSDNNTKVIVIMRDDDDDDEYDDDGDEYDEYDDDDDVCDDDLCNLRYPLHSMYLALVQFECRVMPHLD